MCTDVRDVIVGALYHPPRPLYQTAELLNDIELCVDAVASVFPAPLIVLSGDLPDYTSVKVVTSTGKSDHKAVIAYTGSPLKTANNRKTQLTTFSKPTRAVFESLV